ncbi:P-loop containing nucleoside triphosphate hydrolase protein [Fomitopsis serialis]|uniref:P-loop containing nucleoside triphosphate hydrolase protein n=1 Tax=Fomitopsis serialis TaxID=139415 RepID=UPI002008777C|nr:P-loop containing nucleoside triphosphate hydrolase protein [Neoantrodia serialis]KAH9930710.1 P-loop containing nucleoside triphosphate hydrolase protein [Neoantrodia serialis]
MDPAQDNGNAPEPEVLYPASLFTPQALVLSSLAVAVVLLAVVAFVSRRKSTSKGDALLLVGPSDAGKTAIFSSLVYKQPLSSHTSMQPNVSIMPVQEKSLRVVDVPGHPRIRDQFHEYMADAQGIAFVVDTSTISRNGAVVAEHLHQVLHAITSLPPSRPTPALVIVAHKADLLKATAQATPAQLAINRVRSILERELEKRRASQAGGVGIEGLGAEDTESEMGGLECGGSGEFRFDAWEGGEISFAGTSVNVSTTKHALDEKSGDVDGLAPLVQWVEEL